MKHAARSLIVFLAVGGLAAAASLVGCSGTSGSGGSGSGGATATGSGGSSGANCTVPSANVTSCDKNLDPALNATGDKTESLLSDFSATSWQNTPGKFGVCPAEQHITGALQPYQGAMTSAGGVTSSISKFVTISDANPAFQITGDVAEGDYGGGIMAFSTCVKTSKYKGIKFTLGGSISTCTLYLQVQTWEQQSSQYGGGCDYMNATCYMFPKVQLNFDTTQPTKVMFADLTGGIPATADLFTQEMIGIQWHLEADNGDCTGISMTVDDVSFITQ